MLNPQRTKFTIAIHGGCGVISKTQMTEHKALALKNTLRQAIQAGITILQEGGASIDAVEAAVCILEDSPMFNAGKGAVYTNQQKHELDACIMDGSNLQAGSVCQLRRTKNPIKLARAVIKHTCHVLIAGADADQLAQQLGLEMVDQSYFDTEYRLQELREAQEESKCILDHSDNKPNMGTVGAVAMDTKAHLAAATSTGGMTNKQYGRIGDSPIIGAGTYANDQTCAVSCTGHGELFLRCVTAHECSSLMKWGGNNLESACNTALQELTKIDANASGGLIAVDGLGNILMQFLTEGMYRASFREGEDIIIEFYK